MRRGAVADHGIVYSAWVDQPWQDARTPAGISADAWFGRTRELVRQVLVEADLHVAVDPGNPTLILGFVVRQGPAVHFAFVKKAYRGRGVLRALLAHGGPVKEGSSFRSLRRRERDAGHDPWGGIDTAPERHHG